jgi:protein-disulfide isomerase
MVIMEEKQSKKQVSKGVSVPTAVLLAGLMIAGSYYFVNRSHATPSAKTNSATIERTQTSKIVIDPISEKDHILGNPQAKIMLVEYSDLECPFCKSFHKSLLKIVSDYGRDGSVAWVYRHFPLDSLHPKARKEAEASECVAELGGNESFWSFVDKIYEITPSNNDLDPTQLSATAVSIGLDKKAFDDCLVSGKYKNLVEAGYQSGLRAGITGTPSTFLVSSGNDTIPIEGAQPYSSIKSMISTILSVTQTGKSTQ